MYNKKETYLDNSLASKPTARLYVEKVVFNKLKLKKMKKFKLSNYDSKSLESSISMMNNPVLKAVAIDVTSHASLGGSFVKAGPISFGKIIKTE